MPPSRSKPTPQPVTGLADAAGSGRTAALLGGLFALAGMGSAAAAVALVPLADSFDVSVAAASWTISLYVLTLGVATAVYGRVADLVGPRLPMLVGLGLMTFGALLAALAPTFGVHLVARLFQGAGAAAVPTLGATIITTRYVGEVRSAALLRLAGVTAAGSCLGPLLGGIAVDTVGWRAAIALPVLGLLLVPMLWSSLDVGGSGARLDILGAVVTAVAAAGLVLLVQSPSTGLTVALVGLGLLILGVPAAALRVRHRPHGFLPLSVVRNPLVVRSAIAAAAIPAAWFALLVAVPGVLIGHGWDSWEVGLALVPCALVGLLTPRLARPVLSRIGAGASLVVSATVAALALVVAAVGAATGFAVVLVLAVVCVTLAFGLGQPSLSAAVGNAVEEEVRGVALGVATLMFLVGGSIGSAMIGGVGHVLGVANGLLVLTALPLLGVLLLLPTLRADPVHPADRPDRPTLG